MQRSSGSLLIGESASKADRAEIVLAIETSPSVDALIHMRTQHLGPDEILVAAKVEYDSSLAFDQLADVINVTERNVREAVSAAKVIYIEPDLRRAPPAPTMPDADSRNHDH